MNKTEKQALKDKYKNKLNSTLHSHGSFKVIDSNESIHSLRGLVTTSSVDSENEVVLPDGLDWTYFIKTGGWVYWRHAEIIDDINVLPIGAGKDINKTDQGWEATTNLLKRPDGWVNWLPDAIYSMVSDPASNGKLGASIGFIPTEGRPATAKDKSIFGNDAEWVWTKAKVMEYSLCPDPSNADSMNAVIKSASNSSEYKDYIKEQLKLKSLEETEKEIEETISKEIDKTEINDFSKVMEMLTNLQNQMNNVLNKIEKSETEETVTAVEPAEPEIPQIPETVALTTDTDPAENTVVGEIVEEEQEEMEEFVYVARSRKVTELEKKLGKIEIN